MADLLECLIQIKALGETLRLAEAETSSISSSEPAGLVRVPDWQVMCDAERRCAAALGTNSPGRLDLVPSADAEAGPRAEFLRLRRANLARLNNCTAAELAGPVEWPDRRSTTVADLVAIMLANDTEVLGELRRVRSNPESGVT
jgi:hypothetical protein